MPSRVNPKQGPGAGTSEGAIKDVVLHLLQSPLLLSYLAHFLLPTLLEASLWSTQHASMRSCGTRYQAILARVCESHDMWTVEVVPCCHVPCASCDMCRMRMCQLPERKQGVECDQTPLRIRLEARGLTTDFSHRLEDGGRTQTHREYECLFAQIHPIHPPFLCSP